MTADTNNQWLLRECFRLSFIAAGTGSFFLLPFANNFRLQSETQRVLYMDGETVAEARKHILTEFKEMIIETIIANAFRVARTDCAMEPLLILMSVPEKLSALSVRELIFFTLKVFEEGDGLLDSLVEVLQARVEEDTP
jgi:hypothetical protein